VSNIGEPITEISAEKTTEGAIKEKTNNNLQKAKVLSLMSIASVPKNE
jgi:hypothetical protein